MDTITNENGQLRSCDGPNAVEAYRLKALITALGFEIKCPGMQMTRGRSALAIAKTVTGLRTNKREVHIERLRVMYNDALSKCLIVTDGE